VGRVAELLSLAQLLLKVWELRSLRHFKSHQFTGWYFLSFTSRPNYSATHHVHSRVICPGGVGFENQFRERGTGRGAGGKADTTSH